jgi:protein phosphatase
VRERNEDSYLALAAPALTPEIDALLVVADGMGGHQGGEVASTYLVEQLDRLFSSSAYRRLVHYNPEHADYYAAVLKEVLEQINEELYTLGSNQKELRGMGTTATVALVTEQRLFIGHVGDSRAYLMRDGVLRLLTQDHSWVAEQALAGKMSPAEAAVHPRKNVLTRSMGNSLVVRVDRALHQLRPGDQLLLCSDGLTNYASDAELRQAVTKHAEPQAACDWLVSLANQRGGGDNITAIVARFSGDSKENSLLAQGGRAKGPQREGDAATITQKIMRPRQSRCKLNPALVQGALLGFAAVLLSMAAGAVAYLAASYWTTGLEPILSISREIAVAVGGAMLLLLGILIGLALARLRRSAEPNEAERGTKL